VEILVKKTLRGLFLFDIFYTLEYIVFVGKTNQERMMKEKLAAAFATVNARLHAADQEWAAHKLDTLKAFVEAARAEHKAGGRFDSGFGRFDSGMAAIAHFGSKAMWNLLVGHGREGALANMAKNTNALIAKRDATIIAALNKKGITEIPDFELVECSDGIEGAFNVAGHVVTISTILAGGYNIQRLHNRTLVKVC
jgi:hypothetical protein